MAERIFLSAPHLTGREQHYIQEAFDGNWIGPLGPHVEAFEHMLEEIVGVRRAVALSSGTAAIHLALQTLGVRRRRHGLGLELHLHRQRGAAALRRGRTLVRRLGRRHLEHGPEPPRRCDPSVHRRRSAAGCGDRGRHRRTERRLRTHPKALRRCRDSDCRRRRRGAGGNLSGPARGRLRQDRDPFVQRKQDPDHVDRRSVPHRRRRPGRSGVLPRNPSSRSRPAL